MAVRVHDESINTWGFYCLTSGLDLKSFKANPIFLYNHLRAWQANKNVILPIGYWRNVKKDGKEVLGDPVFDAKDKFAKEIAGKFERKVLRAFSVGIRILETSNDPKLMKPGQTRDTVVRWELREISIVDIPSNRNAVVLYDKDDNLIELKDDGSNCPVPLLDAKLSDINQPVKNKPFNMENLEGLKIVAGFLALKPDATLSDVQSKISDLMTLKAKNKQLSDELKTFKDKQKEGQSAEAKNLLDVAIKDNKIDAAQRKDFEKLFDNDFDSTKSLLESLKVTPKLSDVINLPDGGANLGDVMKYQGKTFSELSKEKPKVLEQLKDKQPQLFKQLFKSEYGKDYGR